MHVDFERWKREYHALAPANADEWMEHCRTTPSLADALMDAALARDGRGRKHPHQHRLPDRVLRGMGERLVEEAGRVVTCRDFDALHRIVEECRVPGVGELALYDTALRIGWRLGVIPGKVYLHAGTRIGAERIGITHRHPDYIERDELPEAWRDLEPYEVEDILCIYKERFLAPPDREAPPNPPRGRYVC